MPRSFLRFLALTGVAAFAYVPQSSSFRGNWVDRARYPRQSVGNVIVSENFGFDFAEDSYKNTPPAILGEANYKQWVSGVAKDSFLNRQVRSFLESAARSVVMSELLYGTFNLSSSPSIRSIMLSAAYGN
jgi:hypothetical protein